MVLQNEAACRKGCSGGRAQRNLHASGEPARGVLPLDAQHSRLGDFAATLVGASHSCVALRKLQGNHGRARDTHKMRTLRLGEAQTRRRRARHLVQLGAVAVLDARLARTNTRS